MSSGRKTSVPGGARYDSARYRVRERMINTGTKYAHRGSHGEGISVQRGKGDTHLLVGQVGGELRAPRRERRTVK
jgi:hypothetical protein